MKIYIKSSISTSDINSIRRNLFLYYGVLKRETNKFFEDYDAVLDKEDQIDDACVSDRYKFYKKYNAFVAKCQEIVDTMPHESTGHMADQIIRLEMYDLASDVVDIFPYDWDYKYDFGAETA